MPIRTTGRTVGRREFLELAGAAGVLVWTASRAPAGMASRWSDPATWGRRPPGRRDIAIIDRTVVLDVDVRVAGVRIEAGGRLLFDERNTRRLESTGNVVVKGVLAMRPAKARVRHSLVFVGVDEAKFRGGGHSVLESDVGLWVMHHGRLDLRGSVRRAWARTPGALAEGDTRIYLDRAPVGWRAGDEVVISPTIPPGDGAAHTSFDRSTVSGVGPSHIDLDRALQFDHPALATTEGRTLTAEILNLTRNVSIGGTKTGRAHVFIHSSHRQSIRNAAFVHVGSRRPTPSSTTAVLGRYGLHFHHSYSGSRNSVVENVVIKECGNNSFVPHTSHGITFSSCIAYNVVETPFWWDVGDRTDDVTWENCVAARVAFENPVAADDLAGFFLGRGEGNTARGCIAVGVGGKETSSGFEWPPEPANGVWTFHDCIAHNNSVNGIFVWQENDDSNVVARFVAYHNGKAAIQHGSFRNTFRYSDLLLVANGTAQIMLHANSASDDGLSFERVRMDGRGLTPAGVMVAEHPGAPSRPVMFRDCSLVG
ncbi:MAG: right-handed parallel beta-helix repeat-containing protein, partial [Actinomycetota bacterium]|nr:right-handed parallel beta-helix repeat-containing protein [Actinomycetota bacterium]